MAQKDITLRIKTIEKDLNQALKKIGNLEKTVARLNKVKVRLNTSQAVKAAQALKKEIQKGNDIADKLFDTTRSTGFGLSIGKVRDQLGSVRKAFDATNSAAERTFLATALIAGNFKKITMESMAFAKASGMGSGVTIGNVSAKIKEIEKLPRTILAGNEAMSMLRRMQELTTAGSVEFLQVSRAIGRQLEINAQIQLQAERARTPMPKDFFNLNQKALPAAGESSGTFMVPTKSQTQAMRNVTRASEEKFKVERKVSKELSKQEKIDQKRFDRVIKNIRRRKRLERGIGGRGGRGGRQGARRQSQLLGAGFPLLFGGGAGAVGGSLLGSFLAPAGQEFGGQIFGSAIGTILERTLQRVNQIGNAVQNLNLDNLEQSGIRVNAELETTVKRLKQAGEFEQAEKVLLDQVNKQTGAFGDVTPDIANNINILVSVFDEFLAAAGVTLGIIFTPIITGLAAIIKLVNITLQGFNRLVSFILTGLKIAVEELIKLFPGGEQALERINKLIEGTNKGADELTVRFNEFLDGLKEEEETIREKILLGEQEAAIQEKIRDAVAEYGKDKKEQIESAVRALAKAEEELKQAEKIRALFKSIGQTIEDGLVDAIDGAINKTKTLGDVARSVFRQIQRSLIQFGVNSFLGGIFGGGIPGLGSSRNVASQVLVNPVTGGLKTTDVLPGLNVQAGDRLAGSRNAGLRADGGPVRRGGAFIVGERGPELFTPGVSGMITPNHALGGSTSVVVNVDASGSSVEGDEQGGRELGRLISVAIQSELVQQKRPGGLLA